MELKEQNEIEKEIDVIYTGNYENDIKIFQFPLIPKNSLKTENIKSLGINSDVKSMKMDLEIDSKYLDKANYNTTNIQSLKGENIESNTNLCIGIFKDNKLFLTPISQIYQFRHDFYNVEKEKETIKKDKKEKKDFKNNNTLLTNENNNINYLNLNVIQPDNIESKMIKNNLYSTSIELFKQSDFMSKKDYFDLLMKYILDENTQEDYLEKFNNDEFNHFNSSLPKIKEEKMEVEEDNVKEKNNNTLGFMYIQNNNNKNENVIQSNIKLIFSSYESLYFNTLVCKVCNSLKIDINDEKGITKVKDEIINTCIIVKDEYCFLKDKGDEDIKEIRNILIKEIGNSNGLKKREVRDLLNSKNLSIPETKLNKILKNLCEYINSTWILKPPMDIEI